MVKKLVSFDIYIKTSEQTPTHSYTAKQKVMSNDNDSAQIIFNLLDVSPSELSGVTASVMLYMQDGSFFQSSDVVIDRNTIIYTMKPEETKHSGSTKVQIVLKKGSIQTASIIYNFDIDRGLEKYPITEVMIQDWTTLTAEAKAFVEQIEGFTLAEFVENKMGEELANLEVNYAGRLTGLETKDTQLTAQLAQTVKKHEDGQVDFNMLSQEVKEKFVDLTGGVPYVGANTVNNDTFTPDVADYLYTKGAVNMFNKKTVKKGYMDSLGQVFDAETLVYSDPIPVEGGGGYFFFEKPAPVKLAVRRLTQFDADMTPLGTSATQHDYVQNILVNDNTRYVVITVSKDQAPTTQFIKGKASIPIYYPYYTKNKSVEELTKEVDALNVSTTEIKESIKNTLVGETMLNIGDSQTGQNKWQPFVNEVLKMTSINEGYGGYPLAQVDDTQMGFALASDYMLAKYSAALANAKIATIMAGTNDLGYDGTKPQFNTITIGDYGLPYNIKTYKGALSKVVDYLLTNHPNVLVVVMSPVGGLTKVTGVNLTEPYKNALGLSIGDLAKACEEVAHYFGVPFIDVYGKSGISHRNSKEFIVDGVHLNTTSGAKRVAKVVINGLKEVAPII